MKNAIIIASMLACILVGCSKETTAVLNGERTISASVISPKTSLEALKVKWTEGDCIGIFSGASNNSFTLSSGAGTTMGSFTGSADDGNDWYAVYPYSATSGASYDGGKAIITLDIPTVQHGVPGTFAEGLNITAGKVAKNGAFGDVTMRNVCSVVKFTIAQTGITTITLRSKADEFIAGKTRITFDESGYPVALAESGKVSASQAGSPSATLVASDYSKGFVPGDYYMVVAPNTLAKGFNLFLTKGEGSNSAYAKVCNVSSVALEGGKIISVKNFDSALSWTLMTTPIVEAFGSNNWPFEDMYKPSGEMTPVEGGFFSRKETAVTDSLGLSFVIGNVNADKTECNLTKSNGFRLFRQDNYLILPVIPGYKLTSVQIDNVADGKANEIGVFTADGKTKVVDFKAAGTAKGTKVKFYTNDAQIDQRFRLQHNPECTLGAYKLNRVLLYYSR